MSMKDIDTTKLPKSQKKLIKTISSTNPAELVKGILKFYKCPVECRAKCCKIWDIPLVMDDKARISREGAAYRNVIKEQVITKQNTVEESIISVEVFATTPCPFLHNDRCSIHRFNPLLCSLYPFIASKRLNALIEIVACDIGADLLVDIAAYELHMAMINASSDASTKLKEAIQRIKEMKDKGTSDPSNALVYSIYNLETLRFFLLYLNTEGADAIVRKRNELRSIASNDNGKSIS